MALFPYKDQEAYERDVEIALALLRGFWGRDKNGRYSVQHCSPNTNPTEKEARAALSRLLLTGDVPDLLLLLLAILFTPELFGAANPVQRKVVFKRLNTGHSNVMTDMVIAASVQHLRNIGLSYEKATKEAAKAFRLEQRHVKRIYSKHKGSTLNQMVTMVAALVPRTSTDARQGHPRWRQSLPWRGPIQSTAKALSRRSTKRAVASDRRTHAMAPDRLTDAITYESLSV